MKNVGGVVKKEPRIGTDFQGLGRLSRLNSVVVLVVLLLLLAWSTVFGSYGGGSGVEGDPYLIYDANHLNAIGANYPDWDKHFKLMSDVNLGALNGTPFNIIGTDPQRFRGVFDGNDCVISNLRLIPTDANELFGISTIGMFGAIGGGSCEIRNVILRDFFVDGRVVARSAGGLIGRASDDSLIQGCVIESGQVFGECSAGGFVAVGFEFVMFDCHASCNVDANSLLSCGESAGLLVGSSSSGDIHDCTSSGSVSGGSAGGLVGWSGRATITGCESWASVTGIDFGSTGGLIGGSNASVFDCIASGDIQGSGHTAGGLVGVNAGRITRSFAIGNVVCEDCYSSGGLVGENLFWELDELKSRVTYSFATGNVSGHERVGGLVGCNAGTISNSYAFGDVEGVTNIGGLAGRNENPYSDGVQYGNGNIYKSYSTGSVSGDSYVGGLVGLDFGYTIVNSFWDIQTSGQASSDGGIGKTTAQMHEESTFTSAGWDFNTPTWKICCEGSYPKLWWEEVSSALTVSSLELDFETLEGQVSSESQSLYISNCGSSSIIEWELIEDCNWLWVEPNSGVLGSFERTEVTIYVNTIGMSAGSYECQFSVFDPCD
ncbi:MAG: GLUG motif-containing protein, partial [Planctomycetota bacterium]